VNKKKQNYQCTSKKSTSVFFGNAGKLSWLDNFYRGVITILHRAIKSNLIASSMQHLDNGLAKLNVFIVDVY